MLTAAFLAGPASEIMILISKSADLLRFTNIQYNIKKS